VRIQDSGSGRTMLATRLSGILPPPDFPETLETTQAHNVAGTLAPNPGLPHERPLRAPHHTVPNAGLLRGGIGIPRPGEVSLAHNGVLFLDELPEFPRNMLELPRQPLDDGAVTLARSQLTLTFPERFMLVASMNPCPCRHQLTQPHTDGTDGAASRLSNWKEGTCERKPRTPASTGQGPVRGPCRH
jgi:magnesium chelatase family protein